MIMIKSFIEYLNEERPQPIKLSAHELTILKSRIIPAIRVKKTGKIYTGERGDWHDTIRNKHGIVGKGDYSFYNNEPVTWERGFVDPVRHNRFLPAYDIGVDAAEIHAKGHRRRDFQGNPIEEARNPVLFKRDLAYLKKQREHLLPALKGRMTGKVILGNPHDIHWDIAMRNGIKIYDIDDADRDRPIITGFWHKKDKKFIETEVSTLDLESPLQRMRRFGTEETLYEDIRQHYPDFDPTPEWDEMRRKAIAQSLALWRSGSSVEHYNMKSFLQRLIDPFLFGKQDDENADEYRHTLFQSDDDDHRHDEALDYNRDVLRSRVVPAIKMDAPDSRVFIGKRGEIHPEIWAKNVLKKPHPVFGDPGGAGADDDDNEEYPYTRLYHDPVGKKFYSVGELGMDATELPEYGKRFSRHRHDEALDIDRAVLLSRILPAIKVKKTGKLVVGTRGSAHPAVAGQNNLFGYHYSSPDYVRGYFDPVRKKFYKARHMGIDGTELHAAGIRQYSVDEELDYNREVLLTRVVPALKTTKGKIYTTERGKGHIDIDWPSDMENVRVWGYHDPVTKRFYNWADLKVDASELKTGNRVVRNPRLWGEGALQFDRDVLLSRIIPAIRVRKTGKVYTGRRSEAHPDIAQRNDLPMISPKSSMYSAMYGYDRMFMDPINKKLYTTNEIGIDATELLPHGEHRRRNDEAVVLDPITRSRIVPAIRHNATGKVHVGRDRRETHWQIADRVKLPLDLSRKMNRADSDRETYGYSRGYYDPVKKQYVDDPNFDSVSLLTHSELRRRYPGWFGEEIDPQFLAKNNSKDTILNPKFGEITKALKNSTAFNKKHKALRYVSDRKNNVWIGDARALIHDDIAAQAGLIGRGEWYNKTYMGFIHPGNIGEIKKHGLNKWIKKRHMGAAEYYIPEPVFDISERVNNIGNSGDNNIMPRIKSFLQRIHENYPISVASNAEPESLVVDNPRLIQQTQNDVPKDGKKSQNQKTRSKSASATRGKQPAKDKSDDNKGEGSVIQGTTNKLGIKKQSIELPPLYKMD